MPECKSEGIDWTALFDSWRLLPLSETLPPHRPVRFRVIRVRAPGEDREIRERIVDWWPTEAVQARAARLTRLGLAGIDWKERKGLMHTAYQLYEVRDDPMKQTAILLLASLWDKKHDLPEAWRGRVLRLIDEMMRAIVLDPIWQPSLATTLHYRVRERLPIRVVDHGLAASFVPRDYHALVRVAALEAALALSAWTLVFVSEEDRLLRTTESSRRSLDLGRNNWWDPSA